jgi:hypothetical protein
MALMVIRERRADAMVTRALPVVKDPVTQPLKRIDGGSRQPTSKTDTAIFDGTARLAATELRCAKRLPTRSISRMSFVHGANDHDDQLRLPARPGFLEY